MMIKIRIRELVALLALAIVAVSCQSEGQQKEDTGQGEIQVEVPVVATTGEVVGQDQKGSPLYRILPDSAFLHEKDSLLQMALEAVTSGQASPGDRTLLGRRYMELGRFTEAIGVFSENLKRDPSSLRDLRYRGECQYHLQQFDAALADLEKAKGLTKEQPNDIEYAVDATSSTRPVYNLHFNVFYYLALVHFQQGDHDKSSRAFGYAWNNAANPDLKSRLACWMAIAYRKQGMEGQAKAVLEEISPDLEMIQSPVYRDLAMMFKGYLSTDAMLDKYSRMSVEDFQVSRFGVGVWYALEGQVEKRKSCITRFWPPAYGPRRFIRSPRQS